MSAVKGVNNTIIAAASTSNTKLAPGEDHGKVMVMFDTYEAASLAGASTIAIGHQLPVGAKVVEVILAYDALGASTTLQVGDLGDPDRYITATATTSAGVTRTNAITGLGYTTTTQVAASSDCDIFITTGAGAASGSIAIAVLYVQN